MADFEVREPGEPPRQARIVLAPAVPAGQVTIRLLALYLMIGGCMGTFFWLTHDRADLRTLWSRPARPASFWPRPCRLYFWAGLGAATVTIYGTAIILRNGRGGEG